MIDFGTFQTGNCYTLAKLSFFFFDSPRQSVFENTVGKAKNTGNHHLRNTECF